MEASAPTISTYQQDLTANEPVTHTSSLENRNQRHRNAIRNLLPGYLESLATEDHERLNAKGAVTHDYTARSKPGFKYGSLVKKCLIGATIVAAGVAVTYGIVSHISNAKYTPSELRMNSMDIFLGLER